MEISADGSVVVYAAEWSQESAKLPEPIFTLPQAATGHDINITEDEAGRIVGATPSKNCELTLRLIRAARRTPNIAVSSSPIQNSSSAASTMAGQGRRHSHREALTLNSSRFWPRDIYSPGGPPNELRQTVVRDYLESIRWNKAAEVHSLQTTSFSNAREIWFAFRLLTGLDLE